jgi:hypothetical protein
MLLLAQSLWIVGKDMVSKWKVGRLALNMGGWKLALKCRKLEGGALVPINSHALICINIPSKQLQEESEIGKWKVGRLALNMGGWKLALKCRKLEGGALVAINSQAFICINTPSKSFKKRNRDSKLK